MSSSDCEKAAEPTRFQVNVVLTGAAIDVMYGLFLNGPTWDGDVPSKTGRDELVDLKLAQRCDGYQWLTREGGVAGARERLGPPKKETRGRQIRQRLNKLDQIEALISGAVTTSGQCQQVAMTATDGGLINALRRDEATL